MITKGEAISRTIGRALQNATRVPVQTGEITRVQSELQHVYEWKVTGFNMVPFERV